MFGDPVSFCAVHQPSKYPHCFKLACLFDCHSKLFGTVKFSKFDLVAPIDWQVLIAFDHSLNALRC